MRDPFDPADDELREWAAADRDEPVEDFDLMLRDVERIPILVELTASPKRLFAFGCLYLIVGDAVRSGFNTANRPQLEQAIVEAAPAALQDSGIAVWLEQSRELLEHPEEFDYDQWCGGLLAAGAASS